MNKVFCKLYFELTGLQIGEHDYNEKNIIEHLASFETSILINNLQAMLIKYKGTYDPVSLRLSNRLNKVAYECGRIFKYLLSKWDKRILTDNEKYTVNILVACACSYIENEHMIYSLSILEIAKENGYQCSFPSDSFGYKMQLSEEEKKKFRQSFAVAFCE